jgi:outer membrane lipoprotein-sorting protein
MKNKVTFIFAAGLALNGLAQDAAAILEKVDRNMSSDNRVSEASMTIQGKRTSRTIVSKSWSVGTKKSFTEYLAPASEKGTKMLKQQNQLWIYSPSTDRIIQISGHLLRQSVMGSDLSYEDMMEDRKLTDVYDAKVTGEEMLGDRKCLVLELISKVPDVAYYKQKIWIDAEYFVPLRQEQFAKSGQQLKLVELKDVKKIAGRWCPNTIIYKDMLKSGNGTVMKILDIKFDQQIPEHLFSKAALKQ